MIALYFTLQSNFSLLKHVSGINRPPQKKPSPLNPTWQEHLNDPSMFVHIPFEWQGLLRHSLMSKNEKVSFPYKAENFYEWFQTTFSVKKYIVHSNNTEHFYFVVPFFPSLNFANSGVVSHLEIQGEEIKICWLSVELWKKFKQTGLGC